MITSLMAFLGGSVFRMLWGEISSFLTKKQENAHELEMIRLQGTLAIETHTRNLEAMKTQAGLGIQVIREQASATSSAIETAAWLEAVKGTTKSVGIKFIDAWNGIIRPLVATWSIILISIYYYQMGFILDENGWGICGAALGIYLADRTLFKRGK
jgi:hypothetical protein